MPALSARKGCVDSSRIEDARVSVIIPVHQGGAEFQQCLESVTAAAAEADEVIVVIDGCRGDSEAIAGEFDVRIVKSPRNVGPAAARNLGARFADGEILLFIDADVTVASTLLQQVRRVFLEHPGISAVIGSYDDEPAAGNFLSQYKNLLHHYVHQNASEEGFTFWGACGAIRRQAFFAVGGFDESYRRPCVEDVELGYRLRAAGHQIRLDKHLHVKHLKRWTAVSLFRSDLFDRALPWTRLILESGRMQNDLNISFTNRLKVALIGCLVPLVMASCLWPALWFMVMATVGWLVVLDLPLLRFFARRRGWCFSIVTLSWHWFSYAYSGSAWMIGLAAHFRRSRTMRDSSESKGLCRDPCRRRLGESGL